MVDGFDPSEEPPHLDLTAVAELVGGRIEGDTEVRITGVAPLDRASATELGLLTDRVFLDRALESEAGALLVSDELAPEVASHPSRLVVQDPRVAMVTALRHLHPPFREEPGVHATAVVSDSAEIGADVHIGPYVVVEDEAHVEARSVLQSHVVVGRGARIGADAVLFPHAVVYPGVVLGARVILHAGVRVGVDGFGYVPTPDGALKIPHVGGCVVEDDVEIGANSCIDRGSIGETRLGAGSKLDNLVHIAHNVTVGPGAFMAALVGIAGSTTIGAGTMWGGQSGAVEHTVVGDGVKVTGKAGLSGTVEDGQVMMGFPARPRDEYLSAYAAIFRLKELRKRVRELEEAVAELTQQEK